MKFFRKEKKKPEIKEELNAEIKRLKDIENRLEGLSYPQNIPLYPTSPEIAHLSFYSNGETKLVLSGKEINIHINIDDIMRELMQIMTWKGDLYHLKRELEKSELYPLLKSLKIEGYEKI